MSSVATVTTASTAMAAVVVALWRPAVPARVAAQRAHQGRESEHGAPRTGRTVTRAGGAGAGIVAVVVVAAVGGVVAGAAASIGFFLRRRLAGLRRERRAAAEVAAAYPDLVDLLVLTIKAGSSPVQAFAALGKVAPNAVRPAIREVSRRTAAGERFADAVARLHGPRPPRSRSQSPSPSPTRSPWPIVTARRCRPVLDRLAHRGSRRIAAARPTSPLASSRSALPSRSSAARCRRSCCSPSSR